MTTSSPWRVLDLRDDDLPTLLVKAGLDATGYDIQLTDLGQIWGERLTKRDLLRRARDVGSSIDPSQGDDQYQILLDHIKGALHRKAGTSLELDRQGEHGDLALHLFAPLPGSLPPLKWDVLLSVSSAQVVGTELVTPLLQQVVALQLQMRQLISELQDKDRVISKVTERLEISGNNLMTVFPGVANVKISRKKSQREQLAKHIRGLTDFDEEAWKTQHAFTHGTGEPLGSAVIDEIFAVISSTAGVSGASGFARNEWWRDLIGKRRQRQDSLTIKQSIEDVDDLFPSYGRGRRGPTTHEDDDSMQDDGFQRQETPPQMKQPVVAASESRLNVILPDDESTEDEDDLDAPPRKKASQQISDPSATTKSDTTANPFPYLPRGRSKLGTFGGNSAASRTKDPLPLPSPPKARSKLGAFGGKQREVSVPQAEDTASEPISSPPKPNSKLGAFGGRCPEPQPELTTPSPAKPRSKLGITGGKPKVSTSVAENGASSDSTNPSRLGAFGGKLVSDMESSPQPSAKSTFTSSRSRATSEEAVPVLRENSQERADRKRIQLKRELDDKAKVGVKKKRKF